jgi:hypothetical protein
VEARARRHYARKGSPLFCTLKGGPVSVRYVEAMVKRMAKRAGITSTVTPHVLRHTFATELLDEGANIRQVQEALRHSDVSTTMIYTHVLDTQLRSIIRKRKMTRLQATVALLQAWLDYFPWPETWTGELQRKSTNAGRTVPPRLRRLPGPRQDPRRLDMPDLQGPGRATTSTTTPSRSSSRQDRSRRSARASASCCRRS